MLKEGLADVRIIEDERDRALVLCMLAPLLAGEPLEEGLAATRAIRNEEYRARALAALAPQLEGEARQLVLEEG